MKVQMSGTLQEAQSFQYARLSMETNPKKQNLGVKRRGGSAERCTKAGQSSRKVCVGYGSARQVTGCRYRYCSPVPEELGEGGGWQCGRKQEN